MNPNWLRVYNSCECPKFLDYGKNIHLLCKYNFVPPSEIKIAASILLYFGAGKLLVNSYYIIKLSNFIQLENSSPSVIK